MGRPPLKEKQQQVPVALPRFMRAWIEERAAKWKCSLAEVIRIHLHKVYRDERSDEGAKHLVMFVPRLADVVRRQTGYALHEHPDTWLAFRHALNAHLERMRPLTAPTGKPPFKAVPIIASNDPEIVGIALEALYFQEWPYVPPDYEDPTAEHPEYVREAVEQGEIDEQFVQECMEKATVLSKKRRKKP